MGDLNALRQLAFERVDDVTMHVEALINFVQGALTLEQLDRVIDLMHNCSVTAHFILNQPVPQKQLGADDNMDEAESGTTDS
ncbi:hypothetical protein F2Q70_00039577 [Brassica cretica]|uniref:Uncharacterized protein n=1 Tax=Brassica cretica TaxID=69181 RepID=A0A8S9K1J6_BRACR|nr:hypothetical protein F2Q70_00039577 [Brassica cretica]KAF3496108.1 hypothetical protein DY000_02054145 [Brassica cretica]